MLRCSCGPTARRENRVTPKTAIMGAIAVVLAIAAPTSFGALVQSQAGGKVTVRIGGANNGQDVTNGGVAGRGHFTAKGAITDKGAVVAYRRVKGDLTMGDALITLRFVTVGTKGTITYVVKIDTKVGTSRWRIASGTKVYKGLHGQGTERENADHTVSILTGTVSR